MTAPSPIAEIKAGVLALCDEYEPKSIITPRGHIQNAVMKVYVRVSLKMRGRGNGYGIMLVLASIDVVADHQGRGLMTELLDYMEALAVEMPFLDGVYVEAVNNEDLIGPLMRRGYQVNDDTNPMRNGWGADWYILAPRKAVAAA